MKPLIGITVDCKQDQDDPRSGGKLTLNWNYAQVVADAGGVPILIPPCADMSVVSTIIDGWLIPGGADIDARHFGQENHPKVELQDPARYAGESALFASIPCEMPVLGICYGCQFVNVQLGGTLHQHVPDVVGHEGHSGGTMQTYSVDSNSRLQELVAAATIEGWSYHHQAIDEVATGLKVVSRGEDGIVEAVESMERPWLVGVQWHPERTPDTQPSERLFQGFIAAAAQFRAGRL